MNLNQIKKKIIDKFPSLQRWVRYNYGFLQEKLKPEDYIFGGLTSLNKKILQPDGQWTDYLPTDERQSGRMIESMACTCFSLLNVIEMLAKRKGYGDWNKSDRFTAKLSGTGENGNLQNRVLDSVRKNNGSVDEEIWPSKINEFNWSQFYSLIPQDIQKKGMTFINDFELGYEAVWSTANALKEALKYSPLYIAGFAWSNNGGLYRSYGSPNHAFTLVGYVEGQYWLAYDSYEPFLKKLAWDYKIYYPKVITLNRVGEKFNMGEIANLMKRGFQYIILPQKAGEIYELTSEGLKYISPDDWNTLAVQISADQKKLIGVSNEFYDKLIN